jgi:hypothetical protein
LRHGGDVAAMTAPLPPRDASLEFIELTAGDEHMMRLALQIDPPPTPPRGEQR